MHNTSSQDPHEGSLKYGLREMLSKPGTPSIQTCPAYAHPYDRIVKLRNGKVHWPVRTPPGMVSLERGWRIVGREITDLPKRPTEGSLSRYRHMLSHATVHPNGVCRKLSIVC